MYIIPYVDVIGLILMLIVIRNIQKMLDAQTVSP